MRNKDSKAVAILIQNVNKAIPAMVRDLKSHLSMSDLGLLFWLRANSDQSGKVYYGKKGIAAALGCSRGRVDRIMKRLADKGLVGVGTWDEGAWYYRVSMGRGRLARKPEGR